MSQDIPEEERANLIDELQGDGNPEIKDELLKSQQTMKAAARKTSHALRAARTRSHDRTVRGKQDKSQSQDRQDGKD